MMMMMMMMMIWLYSSQISLFTIPILPYVLAKQLLDHRVLLFMALTKISCGT